MRISDWCSDVCSSDLIVRARPDIGFGFGKAFEFKRTQRPAPDGAVGTLLRSRDGEQSVAIPRAAIVEPRPPAQDTPLERFGIGADSVTAAGGRAHFGFRSDRHTSELQSIISNSNTL